MDTAAPAYPVSLASTVGTTPVPTSIARTVDSAWRCRGACSASAEAVLLVHSARSSKISACVVTEAPASQIHKIPTSLAVAVHQDTVGRTVRVYLELPLPARTWSVNNGQGTKYVTRSVERQSATGMEVTVRCTGKSPGRTAQPLCPAGIYSIMDAVIQNATMPAAFSTDLNVRARALANMTDTVQIILPMVIVTKAVTQKHVAGTDWTAPQTLLPNWQMARW